MADAIPAADAGLLAAQAKSGMEGVKAYQQAQATLQQQRQGAVSTAMQEAALRGAPVGAMESQQSIISAPYDQRMASLTQGQAGFEGDMAARDHRMADYNAAIGSARTLIPGEVEKVVAPIRAQGEATIANTTRQGEMQVSEIDANTRLALAKMQAAAEAQRIASARAAASAKAKAMTLKGPDLQAMLSQGTLSKLDSSYNNLGKLMEDNKAKTGVNSGVVKDVNAADKALNDAKNAQQKQSGIPVNAADNFASLQKNPLLAGILPKGFVNPLQQAATQQYNAALTAWYTQQQKQQAGQKSGAAAFGATPWNPFQSSQPAVSPSAAPSRTIQIGLSGSAIPGANPSGPTTRFGQPIPQPPSTPGGPTTRFGQPIPQPPRGPVAPGPSGQRNAGFSMMNQPGVGRMATPGAPGKVFGAPPVSGQGFLAAAEQAAQLARQRMQPGNDRINAPLIATQVNAQNALKAERGKYTSEYGDVGLDQLKFINGTDPFLANLLTNAPEKLTTQNIGRYIAGEPDELGQVDPYAQQATSLAQQLARQQLEKQGYTISDQDFQNAVGNDMKPGETLAQYGMRSSGQLSPDKLASAQTKAFGDKVEYNKLASQYDKDGNPLTDEDGIPLNYSSEQRSKAHDDMATKWITTLAQMPVPTGGSYGSPQDIMDVLQAGGTVGGDGKPQYPAVNAYHELAKNAGGIGFNTKQWQDQVKKLKEAGVPLNSAQLAMLKSLLYVPALDSKS